METFPYDSWEEAGAAAGSEGFFTFGPGDNPATYVLVAIAFVVMVVIFAAWIRVEDRKLRTQADRLRAAASGGV